MNVVKLLNHKGVKLYVELIVVWTVLLGILFVSINLQAPVIEQAHIDAASTSSSKGMIDSGISTIASQIPENFIYSYTVIKGDSLTLSYRRILNKYLAFGNFNWSKGKRLFVEINLVKYDTRINRSLNVGEYVAANGLGIKQRGDEFERLGATAKQTLENEAKNLNLDASPEKVKITLK